jgi:hypothetical protein
MATTTNNGWTTPDDTDLVKDGAVAIRDLGQEIDTSVGTGLKTWTTYAPTLAGGWANGNGVWTARYARLGKIVHVQARFVVGTTTTKGSGLYINLPFSQQQTNTVDMSAKGTIAATPFPLVAVPDSSAYFQLLAIGANTNHAYGTGVTATVPATWATGSAITFNFTYETNAA